MWSVIVEKLADEKFGYDEEPECRNDWVADGKAQLWVTRFRGSGANVNPDYHPFDAKQKWDKQCPAQEVPSP